VQPSARKIRPDADCEVTPLGIRVEESVRYFLAYSRIAIQTAGIEQNFENLLFGVETDTLDRGTLNGFVLHHAIS
jgi:hypothetical protein